MAWLTFAEIGWEWDRVCYDPVRIDHTEEPRGVDRPIILFPIKSRMERDILVPAYLGPLKKMAAKMERVTERVATVLATARCNGHFSR